MTGELTGILREIQRGAVARLLLPEVLDMAEREGIAERVRRLSPVSGDRLCNVLQADLGYALDKGNRKRMIGLLLSFLGECGRVREADGLWHFLPDGSWRIPEGDLAATSQGDLAAGTDEPYVFFHRCLESVPAYLRGKSPAVLFDDRHAEAWELFLGCREFRTCRALLLELMRIQDRSTFRLLDLCHGPGWGLEAVISRFPSIAVTAIDFTGAFWARARARVETVQARHHALGPRMTPIAWVGPDRWKGFGHPLPCPDDSFEAVLFSCGDPYVPGGLRREVYAEIARVLTPGGRLGILTRCRPDPTARHVPSFWLRISALVHDLAESVCEGWEGFLDADEQARAFSDAGFRGGIGPGNIMSALESCLWVLRK